MNILSGDNQIEILACLTEGMSIRSTERITGVHRDTIMRHGRPRRARLCRAARPHDGWAPRRPDRDGRAVGVGKKQKQVRRGEFAKGDQYTFIALASSAKAIIAYHTGKRDSDNCDRFICDLRDRCSGRRK
jgi:hypothetical protein